MRILDCCIDSFTQILYLPLRLKVRKLFQTCLDQIEKKNIVIAIETQEPITCTSRSSQCSLKQLLSFY